jgi:hypothetical protein
MMPRGVCVVRTRRTEFRAEVSSGLILEKKRKQFLPKAMMNTNPYREMGVSTMEGRCWCLVFFQKAEERVAE